jgi:SAM-dependent methyltransferase
MSQSPIETEIPSNVQPENHPAAAPMSLAAAMAAVALVSFASLLLELAMTRLFSVVLFYHFAFFAISVALLGLGSGGVFAHVRRSWLAQFDLRPLGACLCVFNSVFILLALEVVLHTPVTLEVNGRNFGKLTVIYLVTAVPFFFTGLLFSVLFARRREAIPLLYGADLAGGASACLAVVPLLNFVGAPNALLLAALAMAMAAALWAGRMKLRFAALSLAVLFGMLMAANHSGRWIDIVYAKGVFHDPKQTEFAAWNAISRIEVNLQNGARYIVIDADATSAIMNVEPAAWAADQPANPTPTLTGLPAQSSFNWRQSLMSAAPSMANVLRPQGEFAIIGPGGGVDVLRAVASGSPRVTGIEINPAIADSIMRGRYAAYVYHLYERPQVEIHVQDGRSYIRNSRQKYDVVQMTLVDTWASTAAGAFALSENNLYTVEAFREYFDHLKPDGVLAITRWEFRKPREALRVVSQAMEALHRNGVADPRRNFVIVADGSLDDDGRPVLVLAGKSAFTAEEHSAIARHLQANPNLVWLNPPPEYAGRQTLPQAAAVFQELIQSNDPQKFARGYDYNVAPVDDGAPFFFFTLKTGYVIRNIMAGTGHGIDWRINLAVVVLGMVLIISLVAVLAFLVLPLLLARAGSGRQSVSIAGLLYFVAVGLGYILVEISMIQRFVLFLGHPTYALTVVVFLMLLSSGAGSILALKVRMRWVLVFIVVLIAMYVAVLPGLLSSAVGRMFAVKLFISAVVLVPLGFLMGMPFPLGLKLMSSEEGATVEWAWAMNAAASVLGSVAAMVIAIHFGLTVTLACAALAYLLAAGFSRGWKLQAA